MTAFHCMKQENAHLLLAHPVVDLLSVPVEELQVHALFILLSAQLPQLQQRLLLLCQNTQLHIHKIRSNMFTSTIILQPSYLFRFVSLKEDTMCQTIISKICLIEVYSKKPKIVAMLILPSP